MFVYLRTLTISVSTWSPKSTHCKKFQKFKNLWTPTGCWVGCPVSGISCQYSVAELWYGQTRTWNVFINKVSLMCKIWSVKTDCTHEVLDVAKPVIGLNSIQEREGGREAFPSVLLCSIDHTELKQCFYLTSYCHNRGFNPAEMEGEWETEREHLHQGALQHFQVKQHSYLSSSTRPSVTLCIR